MRNTDNLTLSSYAKMHDTKIEDAYKICSQCKTKKSDEKFLCGSKNKRWKTITMCRLPKKVLIIVKLNANVVNK